MAYYDVKFIERFIRQEAVKRGIDPDVAVRVARSEGLAPDTWQSRVAGPEGRETSYGPYQLLAGGGLGDVFEKRTGLQVEDPSTVQEQVKFALDEASRGGWGPWHGWKGDRWAGIRTPATATAPVGDVGGLARGSIMEAQQRGEAAAAPQDQTVSSEPAPGSKTSPILDALLGDDLKGDDKDKPLSGLLGQMLKQPEMSPPPNVLPQGGGGNVASLPEYIQQFIAQRMRGQQQPPPPQMPGGPALG
ncbi:MAG: hypothetical protein ABWY34_07260 [Pseudoxanthomonas sp.]